MEEGDPSSSDAAMSDPEIGSQVDFPPPTTPPCCGAAAGSGPAEMLCQPLPGMRPTERFLLQGVEGDETGGVCDESETKEAPGSWHRRPLLIVTLTPHATPGRRRIIHRNGSRWHLAGEGLKGNQWEANV